MLGVAELEATAPEMVAWALIVQLATFVAKAKFEAVVAVVAVVNPVTLVKAATLVKALAKSEVEALAIKVVELVATTM